MHTLTFGVGPSKLTPEVQADIVYATENHITEISHRGRDFFAVSELAVEELRTFFAIPKDYHVFYASSATDAMQQAVGNLVEKMSHHFVNGEWSRLFATISQSLFRDITVDEVDWGELNNLETPVIPSDTELASLIYCETSTGVMCSNQHLHNTKKACGDSLLAVDVVSVAGVHPLTISDADVWVLSIQKCLGLPSGLGISVVSPRAFERSLQLDRNRTSSSGYFSYANAEHNMRETYETICTPNILGIYLLGKQLERWNANGGVKALVDHTIAKSTLLYDFIEQKKEIDCFVQQPNHRSPSVICMEAEPHVIERIHSYCEQEGIYIARGLGHKREQTLRIGNFPAISLEDMQKLIAALDACIE